MTGPRHANFGLNTVVGARGEGRIPLPVGIILVSKGATPLFIKSFQP